MEFHDPGTTNPSLLNRVADWGDNQVWRNFVGRYDPFIRSSCRRYGFDAALNEDLCQQVWIELARRMKTYRYDPGKTFRGWVLRLCRSRAIDLIRKQRANPAVSIEEWPTLSDLEATISEEWEDAGSERSLLLSQAEEVQEVVRRRVEPATWKAFWLIVIDDQTVRETAEAVGLSYAATFAAQKRVKRMLQEEAKRRFEDRAVAEKPAKRPIF